MPPLVQPSALQQTKRPVINQVAATFLIQPYQGQ